MYSWKHVNLTSASHKLQALRLERKCGMPKGTINLAPSSSTAPSHVPQSCIPYSLLFLLFPSYHRRRSSPCAAQAHVSSAFLWTCCIVATIAPAIYTTCFLCQRFLHFCPSPTLYRQEQYNLPLGTYKSEKIRNKIFLMLSGN